MTEAEVEAAKKTTAPLAIQGDPKNGGPFTILGEGFGLEKGSLTIGGNSIRITSWADGRIKGELPKGATGDVTLTTKSGTRTGKFPIPKV